MAIAIPIKMRKGYQSKRKSEKQQVQAALTYILMTFMVLVVVYAKYFVRLWRRQPTYQREPVLHPSFCRGDETEKNGFFWYDLGGTECVCDKSWDTNRYWRKYWTGFAFNIPHVIGTIQFYVLLGDGYAIAIGIFMNEVIEELLLGITGSWGFNGDPPSDLEPRYDSLIRDIFCTFAGLFLGKLYFDLMDVHVYAWWWNPPNPMSFVNHWRHRIFSRFWIGKRPSSRQPYINIFKGPSDQNQNQNRKHRLNSKYTKHTKNIKYDVHFTRMNNFDPNEPSSAVCWMKHITQIVLIWQLTLCYNTDYGLYNWSSCNIMLLVTYFVIVTICGFVNRFDFPGAEPSHVIKWHVGWALCVCYVFVFTIKPFLHEMYLVIVAIFSLFIILYWLKIWNKAVHPTSMKSQNESLNAIQNINSIDSSLSKIPIDFVFNVEELVQSLHDDMCHIQDNYVEVGRTISLKQLMSNYTNRNKTNRKMKSNSIPQIDDTVERVEYGRVINRVDFGKHETIEKTYNNICLRRSAITLFSIGAIVWAMHQPLLWDGVMYSRHWCGNPSKNIIDGCASEDAWVGFT